MNFNKKNELVKIIIDYQYSKLETIKLILFIFSKFCEEPDVDTLSLRDYLTFSRDYIPENLKNIRQNIKALGYAEIVYYDNNKRKVKEPLFQKLILKNGKIIYKINTFFKSKLSEKNGVHQRFELPSNFLVDNAYRNHYQNALRLLLIIIYMSNYKDLESINDDERIRYFKNIIYNYFYKYYRPFTNDYYIKINQFCKKIIKLC